MTKEEDRKIGRKRDRGRGSEEYHKIVFWLEQETINIVQANVFLIRH